MSENNSNDDVPRPKVGSAFKEAYQQQLQQKGKPAGELSPAIQYLSKQMGFHALICAVFLAVTVVLHPFAKQFLEPLMALIFPIAGNNSLVKTLWITAIFYWLGAGIGIWRHWPKKGAS